MTAAREARAVAAAAADDGRRSRVASSRRPASARARARARNEQRREKSRHFRAQAGGRATEGACKAGGGAKP